MTKQDIPFFPPDLFEQDRKVILESIREIALAPEQKFILGERTRELEAVLRDSMGAADVVACSSGTAGLDLSLRALGVGSGD